MNKLLKLLYKGTDIEYIYTKNKNAKCPLEDITTITSVVLQCDIVYI